MATARKKKKSSPYLTGFIVLMMLAVVGYFGYVGFVWWKSRQLKFVEYPEFGIPIPANYGIHGIDVSRYQQNISWEAVRRMKVRDIRLDFAFIKATEGVTRVDPYFKRNWRRSRQAGIIRGAYHFFIPSRDGKKQAEHFINQVELVSGDLPPVLDVEQTYGQSSATIRREVKEWVDAVQTYYGVQPIIYTNVDFYKNHLKGHFDDYPLWVAHYLQPRQPRITRSWSFWQHSEKGRVNGIISKVDFNVFNGDSIEFRSLLVP